MITLCKCAEESCNAKSHRFCEISNPQIWVAEGGIPFPKEDEVPGPGWKKVQARCMNDEDGGFMWNGICGPCLVYGFRVQLKLEPGRPLVLDED